MGHDSDWRINLVIEQPHHSPRSSFILGWICLINLFWWNGWRLCKDELGFEWCFFLELRVDWGAVVEFHSHLRGGDSDVFSFLSHTFNDWADILSWQRFRSFGFHKRAAHFMDEWDGVGGKTISIEFKGVGYDTNSGEQGSTLKRLNMTC
jgi:hypothetical protein